MQNKIFISGATGFQGGAMAKLATQKGYKVISLSSSDQSKNEEIEFVNGGFEDVNAIKKALKNVDKAIFTLPLIFDVKKAIEWTSNFIKIAEEEKVNLVVFNAGFNLPKEKTGYLAIDLKIEVAKLFEASQLNVITIVPDIYLDNLVAPWSLPLILEQGIIPYPVKNEQVIPWISHKDLAKYVIAAIEKPTHSGKIFSIKTVMLSGEEIAKEISNRIGKEVRYIGITPDEFEEQLIQSFGKLAAKEISNLYRYVQEYSTELNKKDFEESKTLLLQEPQSLSEWVNTIRF